MHKVIIVAAALLASTCAFANPYDGDHPMPPEGRWVEKEASCSKDAYEYDALLIEHSEHSIIKLFTTECESQGYWKSNGYRYTVQAVCKTEWMQKRELEPVETKIDIKVSSKGLTIKLVNPHTRQSETHTFPIVCADQVR